MDTALFFLKAIARQLRQRLLIAKLQARIPGLKLEMPILFQLDDFQALEIGNSVYIGAFSEIVAILHSDFSKVMGKLVIGHRVVIGCGANIRAAGGEIRIGDNALLAQNVSLIAANHSLDPTSSYRDAPWDMNRTGVSLGKNVWVGTGTTILPGVSVGDHAVIAAGAVVTRNVPANEIWAGIPARFVRKVSSSE